MRTQYQGEETSAMKSEIQYLLPINLGRLTRQFPNNLECLTAQGERRVGNIEKSLEAISPGVDVPASSPQR